LELQIDLEDRNDWKPTIHSSFAPFSFIVDGTECMTRKPLDKHAERKSISAKKGYATLKYEGTDSSSAFTLVHIDYSMADHSKFAFSDKSLWLHCLDVLSGSQEVSFLGTMPNSTKKEVWLKPFQESSE
jgi:hypothetical protein